MHVSITIIKTKAKITITKSITKKNLGLLQLKLKLKVLMNLAMTITKTKTPQRQVNATLISCPVKNLQQWFTSVHFPSILQSKLTDRTEAKNCKSLNCKTNYTAAHIKPTAMLYNATLKEKKCLHMKPNTESTS